MKCECASVDSFLDLHAKSVRALEKCVGGVLVGGDDDALESLFYPVVVEHGVFVIVSIRVPAELEVALVLHQ